MQKQGVIRASAFALLLTLFLLPGIAHANNVAVNCPGQSLNAALAALPANGPNTITVTGTCNEHVSVVNMQSLIIVAGAGGAKIVAPQDFPTFRIARSQFIGLVNLEIVGVPGSMPGSVGSGGTGVFITGGSNVQINGCDIHDNQGGGVVAIVGSLLSLNNTNIHNNNPFNGLTLGNSRADVIGTTIQNNGSPGLLNLGNLGNPASATAGVGVSVGGNSTALFHENNLIQNNADVGIIVRVLSTVLLTKPDSGTASPTTIQGHNLAGIVVQLGSHLQVNGPVLVQGNGVACPSETSIACGGIFGAGDATVELAGAGTVSGNHGAGIFAEQGTNLHLNGATISNNSGDGVHIRWISTADFRDFGGGPNAITGNGGASVFCDQRSLAIGNLTGFSNVKCGD